MNVCPVCGFRNPDQNLRCFRCEALLKADDAEYERSVAEADRKREWQWSITLRGWLERIWQRTPTRAFWETPENLTYRFPWTAAVLSIVPGAGQLYNHQWKKALLFSALMVFGAGICVLTLTWRFSNVLLIGLLLMWLNIWSDALGTAVRINGQDWSLRNSIASWFAIMFMAGIVITAMQFLIPALILLAIILWGAFITSMYRSEAGHWATRSRFLVGSLAVLIVVLIVVARHRHTDRIFTFVHIFKSAHEPVLSRGDIVLVNNIGYWFGEPQAGDMVHCNPGAFTLEQSTGLGANVYRINIQDYFQRVMGGPGDRLERKGGKYYLNGKQLPSDREPIRGDLLPDGVFDVPPGKYFVPITTIPYDPIGGMVMVMVGGISPDSIKNPGIMKQWFEASLVGEEDIFGRAVAVVNPPLNRRWLPRMEQGP